MASHNHRKGSAVKVTDFITNIENKTSIPIDDMVLMGKRENNKKRDFLFINRYLGKHIATPAYRILEVFELLYDEIAKTISPDEKVLVVGFAETATALAQSVFHMSILKENTNMVYYTQTTREQLVQSEAYSNITFEEEHSHATTQKLYIQSELPEFDRVLFIEDEITTGNTILNFIAEFDKLNANTQYTVASLLNWQNAKHRKQFEDRNITRIALVTGEMREDAPTIVLSNEVDTVPVKVEIESSPTIIPESDIRYGMTRDQFETWIWYMMDRYYDHSRYITTDSIVMGTEEFMYIPMLIAQKKQLPFCATTRSPITPATDEDYPIYSRVELNSAYEDGRTTYLYNYNDKVRINFITDVRPSDGFVKSVNGLSHNHRILALN